MNLTDLNKCIFSLVLLLGLSACGGKGVSIAGNEYIAETEFVPTQQFQSAPATEPFSAIGCAGEGAADQSISVLLVGNSLMDDIRSKLRTLLSCGGYTPNIGASNPGGFYLSQHDDLIATSNMISEGYDLVLLQEQSSSIVTHVPPYPTLNSLQSKIDAAGSQLGFYQTWAFQERDIERTNSILNRYEFLGEEFDAPVIHIGRAWDNFYKSHNENPPFQLFADYAHATPHGKALITYVLYSYLTESSAEYLSPLSLSEEDSYILQKLAWDTFTSYGT